jgi:hypothetical protein
MRSGKQIGALVLLSLLFVKAMVVPALFVNYELRKDFIIKNYCINKDRPELHCDGKCYLAKQLKAAEQQDEQQATNTFLSKVFEVETKFPSVSFVFDPIVSALIKTHSFYQEADISRIRVTGVFHPPQV